VSEVTLHFENARAAQSLFGGDTSHLQLLDEVLGVRATVRDGWIKLSGRALGVKRAKRLLEILHEARKGGVVLRAHEFRYGLHAVASGEEDRLAELFTGKVTTSARKHPITPKTFSQKAYVDLIGRSDIVFGIGPAGTGKTYLAMAMAVAALKEGRVERIVLTRPAVEAGESLGFLPGDLQEKLMPYLRPLYDALQEMVEEAEVVRLMERGIIEIAPLAYMRGRTLGRSFLVLDEAQNSTTEQMFLFLTRLGPESKAVVTGDPTQIDLPHTRKSGLVEAVQALQEVPGVAIHRFEESDVVRHEIVGRIITAYRHHRGLKNTSLTL